MAKKIFFGNYKGGVGKTTSTFQIAYELYENHNASVLLLDLDPQSSLSELCMRSRRMELDAGKAPDGTGKLSYKTLNYVYALYMQARKMNNIKFTIEYNTIVQNICTRNKDASVTSTQSAINTVSPPSQGQIRLDFIPNSLFSEYGGLDKISMDVGKGDENLLILRDFIEDNKLNIEYDYIFFDCPPSNNIITQSAFLYCDYYIIPTIMDKLSVKGVKHYISVIEGIYNDYCVNHEHSDVLSLLFGSKPQLIGIFETMRKETAGTDSDKKDLKQILHEDDIYDSFFEFEITHLVDIPRSTGEGQKIDLVGFEELTIEMRDRLNAIEQGEAHKKLINDVKSRWNDLVSRYSKKNNAFRKNNDFQRLINEMRDCLKNDYNKWSIEK